jgi:hypothetical protein
MTDPVLAARRLLPVRVILCLTVLNGCAAASRANRAPDALPVQIAVTNESEPPRRFELRVNGVVVKDTVVGRPRDLTGMVMNDYILLVPGRYDLVLIDYLHQEQFKAHLSVKPGSNCIRIALMTPRTEFEALNGACIFA